MRQSPFLANVDSVAVDSVLWAEGHAVRRVAMAVSHGTPFSVREIIERIVARRIVVEIDHVNRV